MHTGANGHGLLRQVDAQEVHGHLIDVLKALVNLLPPKVAQVQENAAVQASAFVDLRLLRTGDHVTRGQLHHVGGVPFHEALSVGVDQVCAFAAGGLGDEHAVALERGGVVLDHLHVHQRRPGSIGERHPVAGADQGVGCRLVQAAKTTGRQDDGPGLDDVQLAAHHVHGDHALATTVLNHQGRHEPLLVYACAGLDQLLVHDVEHGLSGEVRHEERACPLLAAEVASAEAAGVVTAEDHAEVLLLDYGAAGFAAEDLDRVLIPKVVAALDGLERVLLPGVAPVREGSVDAALGGVGVAAYRVHLGDDRSVSPGVVGSQGSAQSCETGADNQDIVFEHATSSGQLLCGRPAAWRLAVMNRAIIYHAYGIAAIAGLTPVRRRAARGYGNHCIPRLDAYSGWAYPCWNRAGRRIPGSAPL